MATPPTFSTSVASVWNTATSPKTTGTFSAAVGDVIVSAVADENDQANENFTWSNSGTAQTWTEQAETGGQSNSDCWAQTATTVVANTLTSQTVSATRTAGGAEFFGVIAYVFTGTDGIGASARTTGAGGAATLNITPTYDNSALVVVCADWSAADGASRVWRTVNGFTPTAGNGQEKAYFRDSSHYAVYSAYYPDAGAAGVAKTVGLSTPSGGEFQIAVVEVRGTTGGGGTTYSAAGAVPVASGLAGVVSAVLLAGAAVGIGSGLSGSVTSTLPTSGAVAVSSAVAGDPVAVHPVSGATPVTSTASGTVGRIQSTSGAVPITSSTSGNATVTSGAQTYPAASVAIIASDASGAVTARLVASGSLPAVTSAAGSPVAVHPVTGTVPVVTATTGNVTVTAGAVTYPAAGTATVTSETAGAVTARLTAAGVVPGATTAAGSVTARLPASGAVPVSSGVTGAATVVSGPQTLPATGTVAVVSGMVGAPTLRAVASGAIPVTCSVVGSVAAKTPATGVVNVLTGAAGTVWMRFPAAGTVPILAALTGNATILSGTVPDGTAVDDPVFVITTQPRTFTITTSARTMEIH